MLIKEANLCGFCASALGDIKTKRPTEGSILQWAAWRHHSQSAGGPAIFLIRGHPLALLRGSLVTADDEERYRDPLGYVKADGEWPPSEPRRCPPVPFLLGALPDPYDRRQEFSQGAGAVTVNGNVA